MEKEGLEVGVPVGDGHVADDGAQVLCGAEVGRMGRRVFGGHGESRWVFRAKYGELW